MPKSIILVSTNHRQFSNTYVAKCSGECFLIQIGNKFTCRHVSQSHRLLNVQTLRMKASFKLDRYASI